MSLVNWIRANKPIDVDKLRAHLEELASIVDQQADILETEGGIGNALYYVLSKPILSAEEQDPELAFTLVVAELLRPFEDSVYDEEAANLFLAADNFREETILHHQYRTREENIDDVLIMLIERMRRLPKLWKDKIALKQDGERKTIFHHQAENCAGFISDDFNVDTMKQVFGIYDRSLLTPLNMVCSQTGVERFSQIEEICNVMQTSSDSSPEEDLILLHLAFIPNSNGMNPLHHFCNSISDLKVPTIKILFKLQATLGIAYKKLMFEQDRWGHTPLHYLHISTIFPKRSSLLFFGLQLFLKNLTQAERKSLTLLQDNSCLTLANNVFKMNFKTLLHRLSESCPDHKSFEKMTAFLGWPIVFSDEATINSYQKGKDYSVEILQRTCLFRAIDNFLQQKELSSTPVVAPYYTIVLKDFVECLGNIRKQQPILRKIIQAPTIQVKGSTADYPFFFNYIEIRKAFLNCQPWQVVECEVFVKGNLKNLSSLETAILEEIFNPPPQVVVEEKEIKPEIVTKIEPMELAPAPVSDGASTRPKSRLSLKFWQRSLPQIPLNSIDSSEEETLLNRPVH